MLTSGCSQDTPRTTTTTPPSGSPTAVTSAPAEPAFVQAARLGDAQAVGRMLREGAAVDDTDAAGRTGLGTVVEEGDGAPSYIDTVRLLVARGAAVPPALVEKAEIRGQDAVADTLTAVSAGPPLDPPGALLAAAASGNADLAAAAVRAGAGLEVRDARQRTPLLLAVTGDRLEVARLMVGPGADPDALDDRHDTPWLVTGVTGSVPMLEILLPADPDLTIRNRFGGVSVIPAAERGLVDYVRRVVQTGIDVNHVNDPGWTALLEAVVYGDGSTRYQEIVRILLAAGADPSIVDANGRTALEHAEARGQREVAQVLQGG